MKPIFAEHARSSAPVAAACLLVTVLSATRLHAEEMKTQPLMVAFHIDVLNDSDVPAASELPSFDKAEFDLIGVPLKFGTKRGTGEGKLGLEAGLHADYTADLGERLTFAIAGIVSKTGYLEDGLPENPWGTDRVRAATSLRYEYDGIRLAFEPSWRIAMVETLVTARDSGAGFRAEKDLADGFSLAAGVRYGEHDSSTEGDDYAEANAYTGISYRFGPRAKFDLDFNAAYRLSEDGKAKAISLDDLSYAASDIGPAIAMSFPIFDSIDLTAAYRYCRSSDELPRFSSNAERRIDNVQSLDFSASWHSTDPTFSAIDLTASYAYDRVNSTARRADEEGHAATIAFAMPF
ncbi:hypothetical protein [Dongia sp.]|uniref:hypothetical protein n=1 Tax=Dongia sp. TaxID=1977262 RepID=UPI0035B0F105